MRSRQIGLHVDLQRAAAVARHGVVENAFGAAGLTPALAVEPDQARSAVAQRLQRLADEDRLSARAADPAFDAAVGVDEGLGAGLGRGRRLAPDHRGQDERLAPTLEIRRDVDQRLSHDAPSFGHAVRRAAASTPWPA